jgi:hypothetical protein
MIDSVYINWMDTVQPSDVSKCWMAALFVSPEVETLQSKSGISNLVA